MSALARRGDFERVSVGRSMVDEDELADGTSAEVNEENARPGNVGRLAKGEEEEDGLERTLGVGGAEIEHDKGNESVSAGSEDLGDVTGSVSRKSCMLAATLRRDVEDVVGGRGRGDEPPDDADEERDVRGLEGWDRGDSSSCDVLDRTRLWFLRLSGLVGGASELRLGAGSMAGGKLKSRSLTSGV